MNDNILCLIDYQMANNDVPILDSLIELGVVSRNQLVDAVVESGKLYYLPIPKLHGLDKEQVDRLADYAISAKSKINMLILARVPNAPVEKLVDAIISTRDPKFIYLFAKDVPNAPIRKLTDAIIETGNEKIMMEFAKEVKDAPTLEILGSKTKSAKYFYELAINNPESIGYLEDEIISTGDLEYIYRFAKDIKGASVDKLVGAIIDSGESEYMYKCAKDVNGAPMDVLVEGVINSCNDYFMTQFALNIPNVPVDKLADVVIKLDDSEQIARLAAAPFAPMEQIVDAIVKTENSYVINGFTYAYPQEVERVADSLIEMGSFELLLNYVKSFVLDNLPLDKLVDALTAYGDDRCFSPLTYYGSVSSDEVAAKLKKTKENPLLPKVSDRRKASNMIDELVTCVKEGRFDDIAGNIETYQQLFTGGLLEKQKNSTKEKVFKPLQSKPKQG